MSLTIDFCLLIICHDILVEMKTLYFKPLKSDNYVGCFLVFLGILALGFSIYSCLQTYKQQVQVHRMINRTLDSLALIKKDKFNNDNPEKTETTQKIKKQINYPWEILFSTLEAVHSSKISLLALTPNVEKNEVLISAQTTDIHLMLEYIQALEHQKSIDHVELIRQVLVDANQQEKLGFFINIKLVKNVK
jgi:hypothetical protein